MKARGFTLLEVLVALAIFALGAVVLGSAYANVLNAYAGAREATRVEGDLRFARELLLTQPDRDKVEEGGEFATVETGRVVWQALVDATATPDLYRVLFVAELVPPEGGRPRIVEQTLYLLRPDWRVAGEAETEHQELKDRVREHLEAQDRSGR
jgi:general secretion pathway protein I